MLRQPFAYTNQKGATYFLHSQTTQLRSGRQQTIYFFAKEAKPNALTAVPAGYQVAESKSGLPILRKLERDIVA